MELKQFESEATRDMRFGEILVFRQAHIDVYNTTPNNDCPAELWDALDPETLKKEYRAHKVILNGPHYWMFDEGSFKYGDTESFGGLEASWVAKLPLRTAIKAAMTGGAEPFEIFTPTKTQKIVYEAGKPVYEIVDPDGHAYVLQAHDEENPMDTLADMGNRMKDIPEGWSYRTRTLDQDLVLDLSPDETIYAVGDEYQQYYTRIPE